MKKRAPSAGKRNFSYRETYVFFVNSISFDGHTLRHKPLGGSESAVIYMARELLHQGKKVLVFTRTEQESSFDGVEYRSLDRFAGYIQRNIIDVFISVRDVAVFDLKIYARLKVLWMQDAHDQPHLASLASKQTQQKIDLYLMVSQWQADQFADVFGIAREKIVVTRNGIHRKFYRQYHKRRKKRLVYTSTPFRGLELLLEVFPKIREAVPEAELWVFSSMRVYGMSEEEDAKKFKHLYGKCEQAGVFLQGSVPQEELARHLNESYLFVYPNYFAETSCIAALEAQAAGLPCVVSGLGALSETVQDGNTGRVLGEDVPSENFKERFAETVIAYLSQPEIWAAHSQAAHARMLNSYGWDQIAAEWVGIFDKGAPRLSVCLIVKNEEERLPQALESVRGLADEVILVDTGSSDQTVAIAEAYGCRVFQHTWKQDFSAARNVSLKHASGDWILVLDADEVIASQDLEQVRKLLNVPDAVAYRFFQRSYLNDPSVAGFKPNDHAYEQGEAFAGYYDSYLVRLFRNRRGFRFEGRVHETIENSISEKGLVPSNTDIPIHHYGKVVARQRVEEKAEQYFILGKEKIREQNRSAKALKELAVQAAELGHEDEAEGYYREVLREEPEDTGALSDLGVLLAKRERCLEAVEHFLRAIQLNAKFIPAYVNLAATYQKMENLEAAAQALEKAQGISPAHPLVLRELGLLAYRQKDTARAVECFRKLKRLAPEECRFEEAALAYFESGKKMMTHQDFRAAMRCFRDALEIQRNWPQALLQLGIAQAQTGEIKKAKQVFLDLIEVCKMDEQQRGILAEAFIRMGYLENYEGRFHEALVFLKEARGLAAENADVYNHMGIACCGLGDLPEAVAFFDQALALDAEHPAAKINARRVREALVQEANAAAQSAHLK